MESELEDPTLRTVTTGIVTVTVTTQPGSDSVGA